MNHDQHCAEPMTAVDVDRVMGRTDPVRILDEVIDQAEHDMLMGLAGMILGAVIALLGTAALAIILLSFESAVP